MRYLLTLEKFKSNILSKVFKIANSDYNFKSFLNDLLEEHNIKISDLKDDHFKYIPANKIFKGIEMEEIENYKFYDEGGNYIEGSLKEGDFLLENDGYVHKITKIIENREGIRTNIYPSSGISISALSNFIKIPKENTNDLISVNENASSKIRAQTPLAYSLKISKDQIWEYEDDNGKLKRDSIANIIGDYGTFNIELKNNKEFINGETNNTLVKTFNLKALIKYPKEIYEFKSNDLILGFNYKNELKLKISGDMNHEEIQEYDIDYIIIFDLEKAKRDLPLGPEREEREKRKEGSLHFIDYGDILKMNKEKLLSKLVDKYKLSESDISDIEKYTDFKKIFSKIVSKNPVLVLEDGKIWTSIYNMLKSLKEIIFLKEENDPYLAKNIKKEIEVLNFNYKELITHPLVMNKVNLFDEIRKFTSSWDMKESISTRMGMIESNFYKLGNKIQSYINNFEYENLNDIYIIFNKIKSYKSLSGDIRFVLNPSVIGFRRKASNTKRKIIALLRNEIIGDINNIDKFEKIEKDIKTLIKLW